MLERLILGMDCGYPQRMWARLNSGNNSSIVTDRLCDQTDVGDVASACVYRDFHAQNGHPRHSYWGTVEAGCQRIGTGPG